MSKLGTLKISRSGLKLFVECPRCFWLDLHHKIKRPPGYPYTLSAAVDYLVKREFDKYRAEGTLPPVLALSGVEGFKNAHLYNGPELAEWRNNFKGIAYFDEDLNAILYGAVDDVLEFLDPTQSLSAGRHSEKGRALNGASGSLAVVDYKSSGSREITIYDDYRQQMDIYNYILKQKGHDTYPEAYFVFYQVQKDGEDGFNNMLKFKEEIRSVIVNTDWVGDAFARAVEVARSGEIPIDKPKTGHCGHCHYVQMAGQHLLNPDLNI